jgi:hypothetical protein
MGFQLFQRERSQVLDLLDRVQDRIETFMGIGDEDMHDAYNEASKTIRRLYRETERKITQLDVATVSVSHVMQMMRSYEDQGETHRAVQFAATWMSNLAQADRDEIMLAAGYALPERDQLLRECVHGAMLTNRLLPGVRLWN